MFKAYTHLCLQLPIIMKVVVVLCLAALANCYPDFCSGLENFQASYQGSNWEIGTTTCNTSNVFVAEDPKAIQNQWMSYTQAIANAIGDVPTNQFETTTWRNSAHSIDDLYELSQKTIPIFRSFVNQSMDFTHSAPVFATYGPGDMFITKSLNSLLNKASRLIAIGNLEPWTTIDDSIRGTIVVYDASSFRSVIQNLQFAATAQGHNITFDNKFTQLKPSGYVGVHTAVLIKSVDNRFIIGELQIHFAQIMDGTLQCPKEYTHPIYEEVRSLIISDSNPTDKQTLEDNGNLAQKFVYLFGMTIIPNIVPTTLKSQASSTVTNYLYSDGVLFKQIIDNNSEIIQVYLPETCQYTSLSPAALEFNIDSFGIFLSTSITREITNLEQSLCTRATDSFSTGFILRYSVLMSITLWLVILLINN